MNAPGIKKYYLGFFVLLALMVACLFYAVSQASAAKIDKKTTDAVNQIAQKLDTYAIDKGSVPDSLQAAGLTNLPDTIKYTKVNASQYKICINYQTASSGFDAGWFSLLGGGFGGSTYPGNNGSQSYFDSTVAYHHKKGANCQTINTSVYGVNNNSSSLQPAAGTSTGQSQNLDSAACDSTYDSYYDSQGEGTIASIDTSTDTINFASSTPPGTKSKQYDQFTTFCDTAGKATTASSLKAGQKIKFFGYTGTDTASKIQEE